MEIIASSPYFVVLRDAPSSLPPQAKAAAEARFAKELERTYGGPDQVAAAASTVQALENADMITRAEKDQMDRWYKAALTARDRALAQVGEMECAYFDVRVTQ